MVRSILFLLSFILISNSSFGEKKPYQSEIDSLQRLIKTNIKDTAKINRLLSISGLYALRNQADSSEHFINNSLKLANKIKWQEGIALSNIGIARSLIQQNQITKARPYINKAIKIYKKLNKKIELAFALNLSGRSHQKLGQYPDALSCYFKSLRAIKESNNSAMQLRSYYAIAKIYHDQKNDKKSLEFYCKSLNLSIKTKDSNMVANNFLGKSQIYVAQKKYNKAKKIILKAIDIYNSQQLIPYSKMAYANLAFIHYELKEYQKALEINLDLLKYARKYKKLSSITYNLGSIGLIYYITSLPENKNKTNCKLGISSKMALIKAENCYQEAIHLSGEHNIQELSAHYEGLAAVQELRGNHRESLKSYKQFVSLKDSVFNAQNSIKIIRLEEDRKTQLAHQLAIKNKRAKNQKTNLELIGILLFIALLITITLVLTKTKIKQKTLHFLGTVSILILFEFITLTLHPIIEKFTHHRPILTLLFLVIIASFLIPMHHKVEHWIKSKLTKKERQRCQSI